MRTRDKKVVMSLVVKSQGFPTDPVLTSQPFFASMAKCDNWMPISREILIRFSSMLGYRTAKLSYQILLYALEVHDLFCIT